MKKIIFFAAIFYILAVGHTVYAANCICDVTMNGTVTKNQLFKNLPKCENQSGLSNCHLETLASPGVSSGSPGNSPADTSSTASALFLDMRCWFEKDCIEARKNRGMPDDVAEKGAVYQGSDAVKACGGKIDITGKNKVGFCSPIGGAVTQVDFGGRHEFADWGDFTKYIYNFIIGVAVVLAVVMLVIAGFEWATSGGSSERIGAAQKRIAGALMGLFLAIMSYSILNMINPYLVNLRPPQAWLLNPQSMAPLYCKNLDVKLAQAFSKYDDPKERQDAQLTKKMQKVKETDFTYNSKTDAECGNGYFLPKAGGKVCLGSVCPANNLCVPVGVIDPSKKTDYCKEGNLLIHLYPDSFWEELLMEAPVVGAAEKGWWDEWIGLIGVCEKNNYLYEGGWESWDFDKDEPEGIHEDISVKGGPPVYNILIGRLVGSNAFHEDSKWCGGDKKLAGFFVYSEWKVKWNIWRDARFFIGCSNNGGRKDCSVAVIGNFCEQVFWDDYIPVDELKKGIYMDAGLSGAAFKSGVARKATWPDYSSFTSACRVMPLGTGKKK